MKKNIKIFFLLILFLFLITPGDLPAKDKYLVAVLPFSAHSAENIDYIRYGVWDMLSSRISYQDKIQVVDKDAVFPLVRDDKTLSSADIYEIGTKLKADYVVWGSLTKIGSALSLDGKLFDMASVSKPALSIFYQCQNFDEVIPKINDFAQKINYRILGTVPESFSEQPAPSRSSAASNVTQDGNRESQLIRTMRTSRQGTLTAAINTDFINAPQPLDRQGFWMSPKIPVKLKGMDIGDVNNDGINEVVLIDEHNVMIYQKKGRDFKLLKKIEGKAYENYLSVDVADINENGIPEIIVNRSTSNVDKFLPDSMKSYDKSEIVSFSWDQMGLVENWKTREISGMVTGVRLGDLNGDGTTELVASLVLAKDLLKLWESKSTIFSYDLNVSPSKTAARQ